MRVILGLVLVLSGLLLGAWHLGRAGAVDPEAARQNLTADWQNLEPAWQKTTYGWDYRVWYMGPAIQAPHPLLLLAMQIMIAVMAIVVNKGCGKGAAPVGASELEVRRESHTSSRTRTAVVPGAILLLSLVLLGVAPRCHGESWIFRPSYYSHAPLHSHGPMAPGEVMPQHSSRIYYTRPYGEYFRGGYSHTYIGPNIRSSFDRTHVFESWIQGGAQF